MRLYYKVYPDQYVGAEQRREGYVGEVCVAGLWEAKDRSDSGARSSPTAGRLRSESKLNTNITSLFAGTPK